MIVNPILRGFNPDPSIIRVGSDYYIACSTFEWYPGVAIHHSSDLANWELITFPLDERRLLDLDGCPDSCGVWAPCLSHHKGVFYLVFSNVRNFHEIWGETPNYLITSKSIHGPWSDPVYLSDAGFDGSLFHEANGKKWYLSLLLDKENDNLFGGTFLQEYDLNSKKLVGEVYNIFNGTSIGKTEGPHLYKKDDYYYLITAEGGTEYGHAVTIARSKDIVGPYEVHPENPIVSAAGRPEYEIQKTGHGDIVQTASEDWFMVNTLDRVPYLHIHIVFWEEKR